MALDDLWRWTTCGFKKTNAIITRLVGFGGNLNFGSLQKKSTMSLTLRVQRLEQQWSISPNPSHDLPTRLNVVQAKKQQWADEIKAQEQLWNITPDPSHDLPTRHNYVQSLKDQLNALENGTTMSPPITPPRTVSLAVTKPVVSSKKRDHIDLTDYSYSDDSDASPSPKRPKTTPPPTPTISVPTDKPATYITKATKYLCSCIKCHHKIVYVGDKRPLTKHVEACFTDLVYDLPTSYDDDYKKVNRPHTLQHYHMTYHGTQTLEKKRR